MAVWSDLPEEVKDMILESYFQGKLIAYGKPQLKTENFVTVPLFLVSKSFAGKDAIITAMLRNCTLVVHNSNTLSRVTPRLQPFHMQQVKRIRTYHYRTMRRSKINLHNCCLDPMVVRKTFPNIEEMDVKILSGHYEDDEPIIVTSEPALPRYDYSLPEGKLLSSFANTGDKTQISVAHLRKWRSITAVLEKFVTGYYRPSSGNVLWYALLKMQSEVAALEVRLLIDIYVAKGRQMVEVLLSVILPTFRIMSMYPRPDSQQATLSLTDLCLRFKVDKDEVEVPQSFTEEFSTVEMSLRSQYGPQDA